MNMTVIESQTIAIPELHIYQFEIEFSRQIAKRESQQERVIASYKYENDNPISSSHPHFSFAFHTPSSFPLIPSYPDTWIFHLTPSLSHSHELSVISIALSLIHSCLYITHLHLIILCIYIGEQMRGIFDAKMIPRHIIQINSDVAENKKEVESVRWAMLKE